LSALRCWKTASLSPRRHAANRAFLARAKVNSLPDGAILAIFGLASQPAHPI